MKDIKWDHENFGLILGGGNNSAFSPYVFDNLSVWADVDYKGKEFTVEFQNGHEFMANDFNCPSESLTFWTDHAPEWVSDLWYKEDEDFVNFVNSLKDSAEKYLSEQIDDEEKEKNQEIAQLFFESDIEMTFSEFCCNHNNDKEYMIDVLKYSID